LQTNLKDLTNDERIILTQYVWIENMRRAGNAQFQEYTNSLLQQSLWWSSQLIILELE
jgi:hypothetical protein